jgi:hypothetical protein
MDEKAVIVSPDIVDAAHGDPVRIQVQDRERYGRAADQVVLIPMAEWKQVLVRATRATIPAFIVLAGGGSAAQAATGAGIPPLMMVGLPSTGALIFDMLIVCAVIWILWALWNFVEFWLDMDENAPRLRA